MIKVINRSPARDLRPHAVEAVEPSIMARAAVLRLMRLPPCAVCRVCVCACVIDRGNEDVQVPNFAPGIGAPTSTGTYNVLQVHVPVLGWRVVWAPSRHLGVGAGRRQ